MEKMREGFWRTKREPELPMAVANLNPWEGQEYFLRALAEVECKAERWQYRGSSRCMFCDVINGPAILSLANWEWPKGFRHYVKEHNVKPSEIFIAFILGQAERKPVSAPALGAKANLFSGCLSRPHKLKDLEVGAWFVVFPCDGDDSGHGGFMAACRMLKKMDRVDENGFISYIMFG